MIERGGRDVAVVERRGMDLPLVELSDGYQAMLVVVLDLVIRYAFLPPVPDPMRRPATLVIDEVDLHLHPRWQRRVVRQLARLFPETQILLTTHSAAVVQGAIDDGHAVLVLREKDGMVSVTEVPEKARRALHGAQLGSVLVDRHLFGVASRYSRRFEKTEQHARDLRRKMEAGTATPADRKAFLAALDKLEELTAKEEERWAGRRCSGRSPAGRSRCSPSWRVRPRRRGMVKLDRSGVVEPRSARRIARLPFPGRARPSSGARGRSSGSRSTGGSGAAGSRRTRAA